MERYGHTLRSGARAAGVSATSMGRWVDGYRPSLRNAVAVAGLFDSADGAALLKSWGYPQAAERVTTRDPEVANGWRLDAILEAQRETVKLLRQLVAALPQPEPDWYKRMKERQDADL